MCVRTCVCACVCVGMYICNCIWYIYVYVCVFLHIGCVAVGLITSVNSCHIHPFIHTIQYSGVSFPTGENPLSPSTVIPSIQQAVQRWLFARNTPEAPLGVCMCMCMWYVHVHVYPYNQLCRGGCCKKTPEAPLCVYAF